jgi:hypothetical protein
MTPRILTLLVVVLCSVQPLAAQGTSANNRLFAMQSNFWVNLHHFLYVTARARRGLDADRPAVTRSLMDTAGLGALSAAQRRSLDEALEYYGRVLAERDILFDSTMIEVTVRLSRVSGSSLPPAAPLDSAHARALTSAAPAYRTAWWSRHDVSNRAWITEAQRLLDQHGDSAAAWESRAFGVRWSSTPVPVDVTAYANWAGAYTTTDPAHVTISTLNPENHGTAAFETLFHEVLHTMDRELFNRYRTAARGQGKRMLRNPTHPFIFYTAGEVTRRLFPGHTPFAETSGLWDRSRDLGPMRPLLQRHWQLWLDGQIAMGEALRRIAAEL